MILHSLFGCCINRIKSNIRILGKTYILFMHNDNVAVHGGLLQIFEYIMFLLELLLNKLTPGKDSSFQDKCSKLYQDQNTHQFRKLHKGQQTETTLQLHFHQTNPLMDNVDHAAHLLKEEGQENDLS